MRITEGRVTEIRLEQPAHTSAKITFPDPIAARIIPQPGQYLMAWKPADIDAPLAIPIFPGEICNQAFWTASSIPGNWMPGDRLQLRGPLGHGFKIPNQANINRLALVALGERIAPLLPLAFQALEEHQAVTLFTALPFDSLPADFEIYPLGDLPESLGWADFFALELPLSRLPDLRSILGLGPGMRLPCPAQALIRTEMPCAGLAECGACATPGHHKFYLTCQDGPVFDLSDLVW